MSDSLSNLYVTLGGDFAPFTTAVAEATAKSEAFAEAWAGIDADVTAACERVTAAVEEMASAITAASAEASEALSGLGEGATTGASAAQAALEELTAAEDAAAASATEAAEAIGEAFDGLGADMSASVADASAALDDLTTSAASAADEVAASQDTIATAAARTGDAVSAAAAQEESAVRAASVAIDTANRSIVVSYETVDAAAARTADVVATAAAAQEAAAERAVAAAATEAKAADDAAAATAAAAVKDDEAAEARTANGTKIMAAAEAEQATTTRAFSAEEAALIQSGEAATARASVWARASASLRTSEETAQGFVENSTKATILGFSKTGVAFAGLSALVGVESLKMAGDFQQSSERLVTSAGEDQNALNNIIRPGLLTMASQLGVSTQKLAEDLYPIESAGYHGQAALNALANAEKGAAAEGADGAKVADSLTSALHDYYPAARSAADVSKDSAVVMSAFLGATSQGKMTFDDLAGALDNVLPTASKFKVSLQDVLGVLASMTAHGISAVQASQNISHAIDKLGGTGTTTMREWAKTIGTSMDEINASLSQKGLAGTLEMIDAKIKQTLGADGTTAVVNMQNAVKGADQTVQNLAASLATGETTYGDYKTAVKGLTEQERNQIQPFDQLISTQQQMNGHQVTGLQLLTNYGGLWKNVTGDLTTAKVATFAVGENTDYTNESIKKIGDSMVNGKQLAEAWADVQQNFNQKMAEFKETIGVLAIKIGTDLMPYATIMVGLFQGFFGFLSDHQWVADALATTIGVVLTVAVGKLTLSLAKMALSPAWNLAKMLVGFASWVTDKVFGFKLVGRSAQDEADQEESASERAAAAMESAAASMEAAAKNLADTLQLPATAAEEAADRIVAADEEVQAADTEKSRSLAELVARTRALMEQEAVAARESADKIIAAEEEVAQKAAANGTLIDEGLAGGIDEGAAAPLEAVEKLNRTLIETFERDWLIESPSQVAAKFGEFIDQGLAQGIEEEASVPVDAAAAVAEKVATALDTNTAAMTAAGEKLDTALAAGITEGAEAAVTAGRETALAVVEAVDAEVAKVKPVVVRTVTEGGATGAAGEETTGGKGKLGGAALAGGGFIAAQVAGQALESSLGGGADPTKDHSLGASAADAGDTAGAVLDLDVPKIIDKFKRDIAALPQQLHDLGKSPGGQFVQGILDGINGFWPKLEAWNRSIPGKVKGWWSDAKTWLKKTGGDIIDGLETGVENWWDVNVVGWWHKLPATIKGFLANPTAMLDKIGSDIMTGLHNGVLKWWNGTVVPWWNSLPGKVKGFFQNPVAWLEKIGSDIITGLYNGVVKWWNGTVVPWWNQRKAAVTNFFNDAPSWLLNAGEAILHGLYQGIVNYWNNTVVPFIQGIGPWIAAHKGPIEYDRQLLTPHGEAIMSGLVDGLQNGMPNLDRQLAAVTGSIRGIGGDGAALSVLPGFGGGPALSIGGGAAGAAGVTVHVHVAGTVLAERDLATTVQQALLKHGVRNTGAGITYGFGTGR